MRLQLWTDITHGGTDQVNNITTDMSDMLAARLLIRLARLEIVRSHRAVNILITRSSQYDECLKNFVCFCLDMKGKTCEDHCILQHSNR